MLKVLWDESVPQTIKPNWGKWEVDIVNKVEIPKSLTLIQNQLIM